MKINSIKKSIEDFKVGTKKVFSKEESDQTRKDSDQKKEFSEGDFKEALDQFSENEEFVLEVGNLGMSGLMTIKDRHGKKIRELTGIEFLELREEMNLDPKKRGGLLNQKL